MNTAGIMNEREVVRFEKTYPINWTTVFLACGQVHREAKHIGHRKASAPEIDEIALGRPGYVRTHFAEN
jgi:hypothetical protein